ncbi:hypothetical protein RB195_001913 [Necator americanus]|uniref:Uncharacterized protein n=1 Tax=Necator americanus TaxID=51031 RepID=A0ABR1DGH9_NECAM
MPQRLERTARLLCFCLNTLLFLLSIFLIVLVCLAAINAPKPDISPQPLTSYPQYIVTIILIASFSFCLFFLTTFGFISICLPGSFLMSLRISKISLQINPINLKEDSTGFDESKNPPEERKMQNPQSRKMRNCKPLIYSSSVSHEKATGS